MRCAKVSSPCVPAPTNRPFGARAGMRRLGTVLVNELTSADSLADSPADSVAPSVTPSVEASSGLASRASAVATSCSSRSVEVRLPVLMRPSWHRKATWG